MKAIRAGTKTSKFTVDAVLHNNKYFLPSTAINDNGHISMCLCWFDRYRNQWREDRQYLKYQTATSILDFAKSKMLKTANLEYISNE